MQLSVRGKQLDIGDALRGYVTEHINSIAEKYFNNPIEASVAFARDAHLYNADISMHIGKNITIQARASAPEPYPAFDAAVEKLAKQLRRYKRRLRDHHKANGEDLGLAAQQYILQPEPEEPVDEPEIADQPLVVAEMATTIDTLTVGEAVMRMDLGDMPALLFRNRAHGGLNMVYRRPDGNIGWVDPAGTGQAAGTNGRQ